MSHVFHQLYFHFAWATHSREPLIDRDWRPQLLEINEEVKTRAAGRSATTRCLIMRTYFAGCLRQCWLPSLSDKSKARLRFV